MLKTRIFIILICLLLPFMYIQPLLAGTTGKIAGQVVDSESGESIPGANIIIEGTAMGAASDLDGFYTILQVPPDVYTVSAAVIGYGKVKKSDVRVYIDQTARIDFELKTEVIEGEVITIIAELPTVKRDVSTSVAAMSSEEVYALPISNVRDAVGVQAGVTGDMEIRGGSRERSLYLIDGITLRDPKNNSPITGVALSAIQEISMERGGFNAEYGQVRAGLVNVVTREGSKTNYHGTVTLQYSPAHEKYFGISPYDKNSMFLRPYFDDAVCWTGTSAGEPYQDLNSNGEWESGEPFTDYNGDGTRSYWDEYQQKQYPDFEGWNIISQRLCMDNDPDNDLSPAGVQQLFMWETRRKPVTDQPDYIIDAGLGGPVPFIGKNLGNLRFFASYRRYREMLLIPLTRDDYVEHDGMMKIISDITPSMKLNISAIVGKSYTLAQNWAEASYVRSPDDITGQIIDNDYGLGKIFGNGYYSEENIGHMAFSAKLTHTISNNTYYDLSIEHLRREYITRPPAERDTSRIYEVVPGYFVDEAPYGFSPLTTNGITGMIFGGHTCKQKENTNVSSTTFKLDYTSQVNFNNLLKIGGEFVYNDLDMDYGELASMTRDYAWHIQMHLFPIRSAFYIQDKLETKEFVANLGLRLDYSNTQTDWYNGDIYDPYFFSASKYDPTIAFPTKKSKAQWQISPRLGISHPITENSKLFFNYGHFKQMPSYARLFRISRASTNSMVAFGDPDLTLAKTISYELGYDHELSDTYLIQLAAFYHDITDQPDTVRVISYSHLGVSYNKVTSTSYEDIRGFEATFKKTRGEWWNGFVNYTYQVTTTGQFGRDELYQNPSEQRQYDAATQNLYQHRPIPRPYARAYLSLYTPLDYGPKFIGINPLADIKLNLLADWRAGYWRTWNPKNILAISSNVQEMDWFNLRLRLSKTFSFKKVNVEFFVDVDNVFNIKRLQLNSRGKQNDFDDYMNSLHLPKSEAYDNIPGDDRVGEYRKNGVDYQPIESRGVIQYESVIDDDNNLVLMDTGEEGIIYYDKAGEKYIEYHEYDQPVENPDIPGTMDPGYWQTVEKNRMQKILDDKAYIDMPNISSFNFLNPRSFFFGIRTSFDLN
jgi:outer membrane receptor protein involved in Fe transport